MTTVTTPRVIAAIMTSAGNLVAGRHTPVDATSGPITVALPTSGTTGAHLSVVKWNTNTNIVTISGNIEGTSGATRTLALAKEVLEFVRNNDGSWWVVGGNKTKSSLDAIYDAAGAATGALSTHATAVDPHGDRAYALGLVNAIPAPSGGGGSGSTLTEDSGDPGTFLINGAATNPKPIGVTDAGGFGDRVGQALDSRITNALSTSAVADRAGYSAYQYTSTFTPTPLTNSAAMTALLTIPFAAEQLAVGHALRIIGTGTLSVGTSTTLAPRFAVTGTTTTGDAATIPVGDYVVFVEGHVMVDGVDSQDVYLRFTVNTSAGSYTWVTHHAATASLSSAINMVLSAQFGTAASNNTLTLSTATVELLPPSPNQVAPPLWFADYSSVTSTPQSIVQGMWYREQEPNFANPSTDRITVVPPSSVPGTGKYKPLGAAMRVELHAKSATTGNLDGDVQSTDGGTTTYNRAEVYDRYVSGTASSQPASAWPDPVGSERWYGLTYFIPAGHVFATDTTWETITQWKGYRGTGVLGGSPPLAIELSRSTLRFGGTQGPKVPGYSLMTMPTNQWVKVVVGVKWSTISTVGWVNVFVNDVEKIPRYFINTMDTTATGLQGEVNADPIYLKQGIYRSSAWTATHTFHFGPPVVGRKRSDVENQLSSLIASS